MIRSAVVPIGDDVAMASNDERKTPTRPPAGDSGLNEMRVRRGSPSVGQRDAYLELKGRLLVAIRQELDPSLDMTDAARLRPMVHEQLKRLLPEQPVVLNQSEKRQLLEAIVNDLISG